MPLIKRYANRKLYNTDAKRYITLEGIAELIRRGEDVRVVDHETGEDLTAVTQAQVIFDLERKLKGGLPGAVLTGLIQAGSDTLSGTLDNLRRALSPADWERHVDSEIELRVRRLVDAGKLAPEDAHRLIGLLVPTVSPEPSIPAGWLTDEELARALQERALPIRSDLSRLAEQVAALAAELEQLKPAPAPRRRRRRP